MTIIKNNSFVINNSLWGKAISGKTRTITFYDLLKDPNGFGPETIICLSQAENEIGLSKPFKSIDELFEDLNA